MLNAKGLDGADRYSCIGFSRLEARTLLIPQCFNKKKLTNSFSSHFESQHSVNCFSVIVQGLPGASVSTHLAVLRGIVVAVVGAAVVLVVIDLVLFAHDSGRVQTVAVRTHAPVAARHVGAGA